MSMLSNRQALVVADILRANPDVAWSEVSKTRTNPYTIKAISSQCRLVASVNADGTYILTSTNKARETVDITLSELGEFYV
jgi:uncharacterized protein YlxW (UPF0749 family)